MQPIKSHDIIVLLKILSVGRQDWKFESLKEELGLSLSAIYRSLERCVKARFISPKPFDNIYASNLLEFLSHGIAYAFAVEPGKITRGVATAHSAPPLNKEIVSDKDIYVWPHAKGNIRGQAIEPLDKHAPEIAMKDARLYELLALVDAIRVGKSREKKIAIDLLEQELKKYAERY